MSEGNLTIVCPFCSAPYTARMEMEFDMISAGCDTCGHGSISEKSVEIYCDNCNKLVYKKETRD